MATTTPAPVQTKAPRSQFLWKLHALLENPLDPNGLRWVTDDSFEISSKDSIAIHALSPQFEFHSLSSFIRQLSYYSFRRLSDRRRSTERRASNTGYIVFTHPTGFFTRGDNSKLGQIVRKARSRPSEKSGGRRISMCSVTSDDFQQQPPPPPSFPPLASREWQAPDFRPQFGAERQPLPSLHALPTFQSTLNVPRFENVTQWRNYSPATSSWLDPNRAEPEGPTSRHASLGDFKLGASTGFGTSLPSLPEGGRPPLRKAVSSQELPTAGTLEANGLYEQQELPHPPQQQSEGAYRTSPYPTPTFESTAPSYFSPQLPTPTDYAPLPYPAPPPPQSQHAHGHSHLTYAPIPSSSPFLPDYEPVPPKTQLAPSGLSLPSPHDSPHYASTPSPTHSPRQPQQVELPPLASSSVAAHAQLDPPLLHYPLPQHPHQYAAHPAHLSDEEEFVPATVNHQLPPPPPHFYTGETSSREPYDGLPRQALPPMQYFPSPDAQQHQQWSPAPIRNAY
ncbi:hypothetical protein JCM10213_000762 [Rhodosporidiobolus nylandii]